MNSGRPTFLREHVYDAVRCPRDVMSRDAGGPGTGARAARMSAVCCRAARSRGPRVPAQPLQAARRRLSSLQHIRQRFRERLTNK